MNQRYVILVLFIVSFFPFAGGGQGQDSTATKTAIRIESPTEFQVFQRQRLGEGTVKVGGAVGESSGTLEVRVVDRGKGNPVGAVVKDWQRVPVDTNLGRFAADISVPAGGWYRLELRWKKDDTTIAEAAVEHVGVGEVFVVAGQSNSTNYGSEKQRTVTGMVSTFDGSAWRIANDPQPGVQDGSKNGSFLPAFGDTMYERYRVPVGVASTGAGATSVRQWLPRGERMKNLPTIDAHVRPVGPGEWEATGTLFDGLLKRIRSLGPHGCRAVLWHQGESDAGQARSGYPADRQITGDQYREFMERLIRASRKEAGWDVPWIVAQATYHSEKDSSDDEFRAAQKSLWDGKLAFEGPDTDALRKEYRAGVHFNAKGLQTHGRMWAEKAGAMIESVEAPAKR